MSQSPQQFLELIAPLREGVRSDVDPVEVAARMCWTCIIESGDGAAGALIDAIGATSVFRLLDGDYQGVRRELAAALMQQHNWSQAFERWQPRCSAERIRPLISGSRNLNVRFLVPGDEAWPSQFSDLGAHAPVGLWLRGSLEALTYGQRSVAIVGSRASSHYGDEATGMLAVAAADAGLTIVSGGAYGIDARAHRVALASGAPTIAVLAGGADQLYPAGHRGLFNEIMRSGGAVVTEAPLGQRPARWRFLQRNRLIAAFSPVTIVVEAGIRSGALNTANHALQLGRELGAVPGPVSSASSIGCHNLIRQGAATLVTSGRDVLELWHLATGGISAATQFATAQLSLFPGDVLGEELSLPASRVLDALPRRGAGADTEIAAIAGLSLGDTRRGLSELELSGRAELSPAGWRRTVD